MKKTTLTKKECLIALLKGSIVFFIILVVFGYLATLLFLDDGVFLPTLCCAPILFSCIAWCLKIEKFQNNYPKHKALCVLVRIVVPAIAVALILLMVFGFGGFGGGTSGCTICGEKATNTFQGSGYCSKHYENAVKWAFDNVAD